MRPGSKDGVPIYCAEPAPDVALGSEVTGSASLAASSALASASATNASLAQENQDLREQLAKAVDVYERETQKQYKTSLNRSGSASASLSNNTAVNMQGAFRLAATVSELGGRSQQVLLAREFLYRLCEARANNFVQTESVYVQLQATALEMINSIYASQHRSSTAENISASADLMKQVNEYNKSQTDLCSSQQKACESLAAKPDDKKPCQEAYNKCISAIKLVKAPELPDLTEKKPKGLVEQLNLSQAK